jgi:dTDP-glucose pyrophosphorylase/predicted transcriptional regulator
MARLLDKALVRPAHTIRETIKAIDTAGFGIALVVDENGALSGTVTDGDVRRAILADIALDEPVSRIMRQRPTSMPLGTSADELLKIMRIREIRQIPLTDTQGRVSDIALMQDLVGESDALPNTVVIMAGGAGSRLRPLTQDVPKPLLPVGDRPLLQIMIERLARQGFRHVLLSVNYLAEVIEQHFEDGSRFGVAIQDVREKEPLGTAGSLRLARRMSTVRTPMVVVNGDLLTKVDFRSLVEFHSQCGNELTMGISTHEVQLPFGVVQRNNLVVERVEEKPVYRFSIFAGVGVLEDSVLDLIPEGQHMDMSTLANEAISSGHKVGSFPIRESWMDVGSLEDFSRARSEIEVESNGECAD